MSGCCTHTPGNTVHPRKRRCPLSGMECSEVPRRTILHHLKESWKWSGSATSYYCCDDPECDVVYFGDDGSVILKSQLRTLVGVKETSGDTLLCYCFGVSKADRDNDPLIRDFVVAQTRLGLCSCDTANPSGRCCLKDFPRANSSG
jgi:Zinc binding domain